MKLTNMMGQKLLEKNTEVGKIMKTKIKTENKRYDYLGFEEKVAQEFKKKKPLGMTNTEYLASLLKSS